MPILCVKWLCTQERWDPEVFIIFGAVARYRRVAFGSSHDDAHRDNSALHAGAVRPHTGFVENFFFILPRTGHGRTAGSRFARDDKEKNWAPSWGKQLPGERPRETAET
jgi:hypothetical protein